MQQYETEIEGNFIDQGYAIHRQFFNEADIARLYQALRSGEVAAVEDLTTILAKDSKAKGVALESGSIKYLKNPQVWFSDLTFLISSRLFELSNDMFDVDYYVSDFELHQKFPGTSGTPPHQDNFYFGLDLSKNFACTAYVALNYQSCDQGSLGFYPTSHKKNFDHHSSDTIGFSSGIILKDLADYDLITPELAPGDLIFHHCNIVHAAQPNQTEEIRSNIAIRLFPSAPIYDLKLKQKYRSFYSRSKRIG